MKIVQHQWWFLMDLVSPPMQILVLLGLTLLLPTGSNLMEIWVSWSTEHWKTFLTYIHQRLFTTVSCLLAFNCLLLIGPPLSSDPLHDHVPLHAPLHLEPLCRHQRKILRQQRRMHLDGIGYLRLCLWCCTTSHSDYCSCSPASVCVSLGFWAGEGGRTDSSAVFMVREEGKEPITVNLKQ